MRFGLSNRKKPWMMDNKQTNPNKDTLSHRSLHHTYSELNSNHHWIQTELICMNSLAPKNGRKINTNAYDKKKKLCKFCRGLNLNFNRSRKILIYKNK